MADVPKPDEPAIPGDLSAPPDHPSPRLRESLNLIGIAHFGLFGLVMIYSIYLARSVLLPIILALLMMLILRPVHRLLVEWLRLPAFLAAVLLVAMLVAALGVGIYHLGGPASRYAAQFSDETVRERVRTAFTPLAGLRKEIRSVAQSVEDIQARDDDDDVEGEEEEETPDDGTDDASAEPPSAVAPAPPPAVPEPAAEEERVREQTKPVKVEIRQDPTELIYASLGEFAYHLVITLILTCFLLGFGDAMVTGIARGTFADMLIHEIQRDVSRYLLSITAINAGLGLAVAAAMFALGMPNPLLWGAMAMLLNFIPYVGAIIGMGILFLIAAANFDTPGLILAVPLVYYGLTFIEGSFITPMLIGRRFTINPIVVFIWVVASGALWGLPGMLIGLPLLMVFRIICARVPMLHPIQEAISVEEAPVAKQLSP